MPDKSAPARWTIHACPLCGKAVGGVKCAGTNSEPHPLVDTQVIDVVPEEKWRNAEQDLRDLFADHERLRASHDALTGEQS